MKNLLALIFLSVFCSGFSNEPLQTYQPNVEKLESMFKEYLPENTVYTKVPRGLILSIDESVFFSEGETRIKQSSLTVLDTIISILHELPNYCVVENHTQEDFNGQYGIENWELSMSRSANLVEYMIKCGKIPPKQLFSLGFGEFMPFKDNVAPQIGMNNRIDFVIVEYEAKR